MQSPLDMRHHPVNLREHGVTPGGLALYRVVWADSRTSKLFYEMQVHELPRYQDQTLTHGKWILEKWLPAEKYCGMTRDQWEAFFSAMPGAPREEYPTDGDYELVHIYTGPVNEADTHALIAHMEWRLRNVSLEQRKQEVVDLAMHQQVEKQTAKAKVFDEILGRDAAKEEVNRVYVQ